MFSLWRSLMSFFASLRLISCIFLFVTCVTVCREYTANCDVFKNTKMCKMCIIRKDIENELYDRLYISS